ncbi:MAG TPA: nitroreductase family protein [Spirochaetota bacterium]|nr:nitroreductase family protein [Spirochaetota bacterium]HPJ35556.1 nitroreductase family protein [Spirochaetota bacterium]
MELHDAIMSRRSVRKFTDYHVTDEEISKLMEAAQWAQSWSNTQCWEFIIVRDKELIEKIVGTYSETNPARKGSLSASVLIAVCGKSDLPGYKNGEKSTKFDSWYMFDLGIAVQNIALTAHNLGLGTVVVGSMDQGKCAELLDVKAPYELVAIMPVGQPVEFKKEGPKRREIADFTHKERFGNK